MKLYMFRTVPLSIIRSNSLYTQQWCMSYRQFSSRSGWNCNSNLLLLESCLQTCMTYTIAECTVSNSWWWTEELSETCRVSFPKIKFEKLVHLVGFIMSKFVTMHGHMDVKYYACVCFSWKSEYSGCCSSVSCYSKCIGCYPIRNLLAIWHYWWPVLPASVFTVLSAAVGRRSGGNRRW
jgi:hypothetical protein